MAKLRRKGNIEDRLLAKVQMPASGCWEWMGGKIKRGYGQLKVNGTNRLVHRISFELYREHVPAGMFVCHSCDNRACVNPDHLFLGTNADNMADMVAKGRQRKLKGSMHGRAKLTETDVISIKNAVGIKRRDLADSYGVSKASIDDILGGRSWKHLEGAQNG